MAIADEILEQIPAELDLSTAVALFGKPFREPLELPRSRTRGRPGVEPGPVPAGLLCLALLALLWMLASVTPQEPAALDRRGLLAAALVRGPSATRAYLMLPQRFVPSKRGLPASLSVPLEDLAAQHRTVHNRTSAGALALAGLGLLLLWVPAAGPPQRGVDAPTTALQTARTGVDPAWPFVVCCTSFMRGWVPALCPGQPDAPRWRVAERPHALPADRPLVSLPHRRSCRARQNRGLCRPRTSRPTRSQLYLDAKQALSRPPNGRPPFQHYEALLLTQPALSAARPRQAHLAEALIQWARSLEAERTARTCARPLPLCA